METINYIQDELHELKQILFQNIEALLDRHEKIEELQEKTKLLEEQSTTFQNKATKLKRGQWWAKNKIKVIMGTATASGLAWGVFMLI